MRTSVTLMDGTLLIPAETKWNLVRKLRKGSSFISKAAQPDAKTQLFGRPLCKVCPDDNSLPKPVTVSHLFDSLCSVLATCVHFDGGRKKKNVCFNANVMKLPKYYFYSIFKVPISAAVKAKYCLHSIVPVRVHHGHLKCIEIYFSIPCD